MPTAAGLNTKVGEWEEVRLQDSFFVKYGIDAEQDGSDQDDSADYVKSQEEKFDQIFESEATLEKAIETVVQGKDKSKHLLELAKRNIDLDFSKPEPLAPLKTLVAEQNTEFKKRAADKKVKRSIAMAIDED